MHYLTWAQEQADVPHDIKLRVRRYTKMVTTTTTTTTTVMIN